MLRLPGSVVLQQRVSDPRSLPAAALSRRLGTSYTRANMVHFSAKARVLIRRRLTCRWPLPRCQNTAWKGHKKECVTEVGKKVLERSRTEDYAGVLKIEGRLEALLTDATAKYGDDATKYHEAYICACFQANYFAGIPCRAAPQHRGVALARPAVSRAPRRWPRPTCLHHRTQHQNATPGRRSSCSRSHRRRGTP